MHRFHYSAAKASSSEANGPVVRSRDVSFAHPGSPNELLDSADFSITKGENLVNIIVDCCGNCNLPFTFIFCSLKRIQGYDYGSEWIG
jgi:hypothetical protein